MRESRNVSATMKGTPTFIAQVSDGLPAAPNLWPAMKTTLLHARQALERSRVEQIAGDALDAPGVELLAQALLGEARDADDALAGAARHARERRPHLAADAEHHDLVDAGEVALELGVGRVMNSSSSATSAKRAGKLTIGVDYYRPRWRAS